MKESGKYPSLLNAVITLAWTDIAVLSVISEANIPATAIITLPASPSRIVAEFVSKVPGTTYSSPDTPTAT